MVTGRLFLRAVLPAALFVTACEEPWANEDLTELAAPVAFASMTAGLERTCGLDAQGRAWCWGTDAASGTMREICTIPPSFPFDAQDIPCWKRPAPVAGGKVFTAMKSGGGGNHTWALDLEGQLWAWGTNRFLLLDEVNSLARFERARAVQRVASMRFKAFDVGSSTACAVTTAGALWCWGEPNMVTTTTPAANTICTIPGGRGYCGIAPFQVGSATDWVDVGVGIEHACALNAAGRIHCWGMGQAGQLGVTTTPTCNIGGFNYRCSATPLLVTNALTFTAISAEGNETCGITDTQALYCWGQLIGTAATLTPFQSGSGYAQVDVSGNPGWCGVRTNGTAWCTGVIGAAGPVTQVSVAGTLVGAAAAMDHACVWNAAGDAWCFGDKSYGQLGDGISAPLFGPTPYQVAAPFKY